MEQVPKWCQSLLSNLGQNTTLAFIDDLLYQKERFLNRTPVTTDINRLDVLGLIIRLRYWLNRCSIPHEPHITLSHKEK